MLFSENSMESGGEDLGLNSFATSVQNGNDSTDLGVVWEARWLHERTL